MVARTMSTRLHVVFISLALIVATVLLSAEKPVVLASLSVTVISLWLVHSSAREAMPPRQAVPSLGTVQ